MTDFGAASYVRSETILSDRVSIYLNTQREAYKMSPFFIGNVELLNFETELLSLLCDNFWPH